MRQPRFQATQFTPTAHSTAEDKAKFANHFVRFVEAGYPRTLFHKWFYQRLSMTFGHIAHYNQMGFYNYFFESPEDQDLFIKITTGETGLYAERSLGICGDPAYTYSDVERELRAWAIARRETGVLT